MLVESIGRLSAAEKDILEDKRQASVGRHATEGSALSQRELFKRGLSRGTTIFCLASARVRHATPKRLPRYADCALAAYTNRSRAEIAAHSRDNTRAPSSCSAR